MAMIIKKWGIWHNKVGRKCLWFFVKTDVMRGMCCIYDKKDLRDHLRCENMSNLDYLYGMQLLKNLKGEKV